MVKRLLLLNGLAVLGVAIHHAAAYGFDAMFNWANVYRDVTVPNYDMLGSVPYYVTFTIRQFDSFAIPAFLFVSGFFVAFTAGSKAVVSREMVLTRIKNFAGPFLLWTAFFYVILQQRMPQNVNDILRVYYYIPLVCQYYLLSPYLAPWAKKNWKLLFVITAVIQLVVQGFGYARLLGVDAPIIDQLNTLTPIWLFPSRIGYFSLGLIAGFHRKALTAWLRKSRWVLLVVTIIFGVLTLVEYQIILSFSGRDWLGPNFTGFSRTFYAALFSFVFLAFDKVKFPFEKQLSDLGGKSLGVYLVNTPAIYMIGSLMYHLTPWALGNQLLYQGVLIFVGIAIPLLLMALMSKFTVSRNYYRYVFG